MSQRPRIRVLVAEDAPTVRNALEALVRSEQRLELAAAVGDASSAIEAAGRERPDVALVDVRMPGGGLQAAREIRNCSPETKVIVFTNKLSAPRMARLNDHPELSLWKADRSVRIYLLQ